jgi:chorismate mutase
MAEIAELRKRIDDIDDLILQSLVERVKVCKAIGLAKRKQGLAVKDSSREKEIFRRLMEKSAAAALDPVLVEAVYREIVNMCSAVQE